MSNNRILNAILKYNDIKPSSPCVFCFDKKEDIENAKAKCFPSINYLLNKKDNSFSHFTPNIYKSGFISKDLKTYGYSEKNLYQINCFVIDIDSKNTDFKKIISILKIKDFSPNLILNTPAGYHLYYILDKPLYKKDFSLAKVVSIKIREYLSGFIPDIDSNCNHFGIFRFPKKENIIYNNINFLCSFNHLKEKFSIATEIKSKIKKDITKNTLLKNSRQIDTKWFKLLFSIKKVHEKEYMCGRNNLLFTLSLACYNSFLSYKDTYVLLTKFNNNLKNPLHISEVNKTLKSAYSGKYKGASINHIKRLLQLYKPDIKSYSFLFWYKDKKTRSQRKHSYIYEWEKDFIKWYENKTRTNNILSLKTTLLDISKETKIPLSSLKVLFSKMKQKNSIKTITKRGKQGYTKIYYTPILIEQILKRKNEQSEINLKWFDLIKKQMKNTLQEKTYITREKLEIYRKNQSRPKKYKLIC